MVTVQLLVNYYYIALSFQLNTIYMITLSTCGLIGSDLMSFFTELAYSRCKYMHSVVHADSTATSSRVELYPPPSCRTL